MNHRSRTMLRRAAVTGLSIVALGSASLSMAGSAAAATGGNGYLESGEFGEYYNSGQSGCVWDLITADEYFNNNWFVGPASCAGRMEGVNDNTASFWNRQTRTWHVYTDSYGNGVHGWIPSGSSGNYSEDYKNRVSSAYPYEV